MTTKVGLMGFGRIGRNLFRILYKRDDIQVTVISDIANHKGLEYLLKYDTILGRFPDAVSIADGGLFTNGRRVTMLSGREPGDVKWGELGVDIVVEATARYRSRAELAKHLDAGAKRVILCVPPTDEPDITVVMGVNDDQLKPEHRIISNASITAHCAAPIIAIMNDAFGIERMFFTTVHAYTNDQRLADVPAGDLRRSRAASENIIPTDTNAGRVLEQMMPHLRDKITGLALNVPVLNGSLVDMTMFTRDPVSKVAVNEVVRTGIAAKYAKYVEYAQDPIVSSDVKLSPYSSTFDSLATTILGDHMVKTIAWYDNGWGYAHRVVDLIERLALIGGPS
ncbi:MAG TPA: glyceraldehyde 3-phosphate dehydrogenase NAD-binding domain-containing protein [Terriglobales bacterium]|nr:glyceraldehyde 3-phosphate dehydrogenase NAD-binding domain-containing protein [Terriglobales bacterium]